MAGEVTVSLVGHASQTSVVYAPTRTKPKEGRWALCLHSSRSMAHLTFTDSHLCAHKYTVSYPVLKLAHTRLPSVGLWSWCRFSAVNLQVTSIINSAVGCHYFPPCLQLFCPRNAEQGCYQFHCLVNRSTMCTNSLPKSVTWQRRDCDLNPGSSAAESSTLTTQLPSHPSTRLLLYQFTHSCCITCSAVVVKLPMSTTRNCLVSRNVKCCQTGTEYHLRPINVHWRL